jgi:O-antigen/teichoic acid export membrane protein
MATIAKNTSYFTLALILQKIISLSYFTIYARALGPADLGQYYFAISVTSIFSIFIDLGLSNVVTREVAKYPEKAKAILGSVMAVKLPLTILTVLAIIGWTVSWDYALLTQQLIYVSMAAMLLDSFTGVFYSIARGFHNLKFESISSVLFQVIVLILSLIVLKQNLAITWLMGTLVAASLFNFIYSMTVVRSVWSLSGWPHWDRQLIKELFSIALPFGIFVIVQRFYTFFDSVLLFKLAGDRAVGLYQIPFKIIIALQFLPMAFVASLYPALSSFWHSNRDRLASLFERAIMYCLMIAVPISLGAIVMAEKIVLLFKDEFSESALLLKVSMAAVPFMFLGFPVGALLNACDKQKRNTVNMTITAFLSALMNLILIPKFGVLGACITTLITSIVMLALGWNIIPDITKIHWRPLLDSVWRITSAGLIMAIFAFIAKPYLHPVLTIGLAAIIYGFALFAVGGIKRSDLKSVIASFTDV